MSDFEHINDITTECKCGWGGPSCDVALVDVPLNKTCNTEHAYCSSVQNVGRTLAECTCICPTWGGEDCKENMVDTGSAIGSIILSIVVALFLIVWMCVRSTPSYRQQAFTKDHLILSEWERVNGVASYHPSNRYPQWIKLVFCYRFVAFGFTIGIQISQFVIRGSGSLQYFTVWNFCLLVFYFGLGSFITLKGILEEKDKGKHIALKNRKMNLLQKIHYGVLQVELPCTLLIALVVWGILYPNVGQAIVNFYSLVQVCFVFGFICL